MSTYRWAIMGPGTIANTFAGDLPLADGAELAAVWGRPDLDGAEEFAARHGIPKVYGTHEELMADESIDIIYVSVINPFHKDCIIKALNAGKAVLCEKPLGMNLRETREMIDLARARGTFLMEAQFMRFLPVYDQVRQWLADGRIGEVKRITADFGFSVPRDPQSRLFNPELGGGAALDVGVYLLAPAFDFFGTEDCTYTNRVFRGPTGVDETLSAVLDFGDGRHADLFASVYCDVPHEARIFGSEGWIRIPDFWRASDAFLMNKSEVRDSIENAKSGNGYQHEAMHVMACLDAGKTESDRVTHASTLAMAQGMEILQQNTINRRG